MVFSSLIFLWCIPVFTAVSAFLLACAQRVSPRISRFYIQLANIVLIICSCFFYWWGTGKEGIYFLALFVGVNYVCALSIQKLPHRSAARLALLVSCGILGGYLALFKGIAYLSRIYETDMLSSSSLSVELLLPLGISFLVFHSLSYQLELYKARFSGDEAGKNTKLALHANGIPRFLDLCLYLVYFPKLIQGPLTQFQEFAPQIHRRSLSLSLFYSGFVRFVLGLAKKVLCADVLAHMMSTLDWFSLSTSLAWFMLLLFTLRLYLDFSAYSDMAIGLARMSGFTLCENFNYPYRSCSIQEFWQRWHCSLGAFFKRYVYIPLGGSRTGNVYLHLMTVFVISGLWHEFGLIYLLWGVLHGACICAERYLSKRGIFQQIPLPLRWVYCFFIVNVGWIVFMMGTGKKSWAFIQELMGVFPQTYQAISLTSVINKQMVFIISLTLIFGIIAGNKHIQAYYQRYKDHAVYLFSEFIAVLVLLVLSYMMVVTSSFSPFLYFQY